MSKKKPVTKVVMVVHYIVFSGVRATKIYHDRGTESTWLRGRHFFEDNEVIVIRKTNELVNNYASSSVYYWEIISERNNDWWVNDA